MRYDVLKYVGLFAATLALMVTAGGSTVSAQVREPVGESALGVPLSGGARQPSSSPSDGQIPTFTCENWKSRHPEWLLCEDFEGGDGNFDAWLRTTDFLYAYPVAYDRGTIDISREERRSGRFSVNMPASPRSDYQGATLDWMACDGPQNAGCRMRSFDEIYFRVWVKFAPDHQYVHHFLTIAGSQPDDFYYHGTAGCLPDGSIEMSTTLDIENKTHMSFFYTYFLEMKCDPQCKGYGSFTDQWVAEHCRRCAGIGLPTCALQPQCCWGNVFAPKEPVILPVGEWFCLEMTMKANDPGDHNGSQAYWVNGKLGHRVEGITWRISPTLALNRVRLMHYISASDLSSYSSKVWFDDVVVSTLPVGCD